MFWEETKVLVWCSSICFFLLLLFVLLVSYAKNCQGQCFKVFLAIFSWRNFIFLHLTLYPLIHLSFCEWYKTRVQFCSFAWITSYPSTIYWNFLLPIEYFWLPCQILVDLEFTYKFLILFHSSYVYVYASTIFFLLLRFCNIVWSAMPLNLFLFLWLFEVFFVDPYKCFLFLWKKNSLKFWQELHWLHKYILVLWTFLQY